MELNNLSTNTLANYLLLSLTPGLGTTSINTLLTHFGSADNVISQDSHTLNQFIKPTITNFVMQKQAMDQVEKELKWMEGRNDRHIIHLGHPLYPEALAQISAAPVVLYLEGDITLLKQPKFAIVGTRKPTPQGTENAFKFGNDLGSNGLTIVSGMATGIDRHAHLGGLNTKASSIGVIGTGLDHMYPNTNKDIYAKMREVGLLVSEFPQGSAPIASNFPRRNRIICGLALGCLVIESTIDGGSMITANYALEMGREVMAIPGSIYSPQYKGCHKLIKSGAKLVENTNDVLEELNLSTIKTQGVKETPQALINNSILNIMGFEPIEIDMICLNLQANFSDVCAQLLELELNGLITNCGGGRYQRIFK